MYKINDSVLMSRVDILETFLEGERYFKENMVRTVRTNADNSYFEGVVQNKIEYLTKIRFKPTGQIKSATCTCPDFKRNLGDCKHIIALFFFIREFDRKKKLKEERERQLQNMIIEYSSNKEQDRTYLDLEYNLEILKDEEDDFAEGANLSIRIGENRLYLIRDLRNFFSLRGKEEIKFGKFFTYDPKIHRFRSEDQKIIGFINRIFENAMYYLPEDEKKILEDKNLFLSPLLLKEFLDLIRQKKINILFKGEEYKNVRVVEKELPLSMDIEDRKGSLAIKMYSDKEINLLTEDGKYVFVDGLIHRLEDEVKEKIIPIYEQIILKGGGDVVIPNEYREGYISNVLRNTSSYIDLNFSDKVREMIYSPDLNIKIFFDNIDNYIIGKISFEYDDIEINPFSSKSELKLKNHKILLRDSKRESKVLGILEEGYFRVVDGGIYLDEDDEIYNLVANIIPQLQEHAEVYYSESFRKIRINKSKVHSKLKLNEDLNLLEFSFDLDGIELQELDLIYKAIADDKKYFRLKDGTFLPLENTQFDMVKDIIDDFNIEVDSERLLMPKHMSMYIDEYIDQDKMGDLEVHDDFKRLIRDIRNPEDLEYELPDALDGVLRDYQKKGFNWLKTMSRYGLGGILADDMGLGKTIQIITFLLSEKEEKGRDVSIIVVPTSLVYNWENEISKFAKGQLKTLVVEGSKEDRIRQTKDILDYDVVITSYPLIRNDLDLYEDVVFRYCILDEAQNIKNSESLNARSTKSINAKNRFALTGTPMENSVSELWSIFDFLMPGYLLSKKEFIEEYEKPIFKENDREALKRLNKKIEPFILRRLKKDVLKELPKKIEQQVLVDMTDRQKEVYLYYIKTLREEIEEEIRVKGYSRSHIKILTALTRLRQICCDPRLFIEDYEGGSGKLDSLKHLLEEGISNGHRILIFSQFTSMLDLIGQGLDKGDVDYMYLSGNTPMEDRNKMVEEFNGGKGDVFLVSLKAGGSGLNLVGADTVIHFDPWWNPAVEEQATDRAYRIGQENTVQVIKLITKGTIEEKIFKLQERKKEMIDMVIKEGETLISKLDEDEILSLFRL